MPRAVIEQGMRDVAQLLPPHIAYAYLKLDGLLVTEGNMHLISPEDLAEWNAAIDKFFRLENEAEEGDPN